jgi:3'-phosphoadenosine 5'-phosphosulfate (PAPS) 3'-phosphatase
MIDYDNAERKILDPIQDFNSWSNSDQYAQISIADRYAQQLINNQVRENLNEILQVLENEEDEYPMDGWVRNHLINVAREGLVDSE